MSTPATRPRSPNAAPTGPRPSEGRSRLDQDGDSQRRARHARFERLIADNYEAVKAGVLAAVRAKLAAHSLRLDRLDLEGCYNQAWHGLYVKYVDGHERPENLGGWLTVTAYRRAIDHVGASHLKQHAALSGEVHQRAGEGVYEADLDDQLSARETYRRWRTAARMRLSAREWQAVCLCDLHGYSRREASEMMGVGLKRLDKIITESHHKLAPIADAIVSGQWCVEQRSLMKAFAYDLLDRDSARHQDALEHLADCHGCAAYVRSLRGMSAITPMPILVLGAGAAGGGGIVGSLFGAFKGSGAAAGSAGATSAGAVSTSGMLGGIGATVGGKAAAVCIAVVCLSGGGIAIRDAVDHDEPSSAKPRRAHVPPGTAAVRSASSTGTTSPTHERTQATSGRSSPPPTPVPAAHRIAAQPTPDFGPDSGGDPSAPPRPAPSDGSPTFGP